VSARDIYHSHVVDALRRDGWTITDDPLTVRVGSKGKSTATSSRTLWASFSPTTAAFVSSSSTPPSVR
jgi:hypothetical protein